MDIPQSQVGVPEYTSIYVQQDTSDPFHVICSQNSAIYK